MTKERPTKNKLRLNKKSHLQDENPFSFHIVPNIQVGIAFNDNGVKMTGGIKKKGRR